AVTRMTDNGDPQRLCYRANVFRQAPTGYHGKQVEFYQAGVELLFVGGVLADAEILLLMTEALHQLGVTESQIILGEAGLTRSLLAIFPTELQTQIRHCMVNLDFVKLQGLDYPSAELKDWARQLFDLRGDALTVLAKVSQFSLDTESLERVNNLKSLVEIVNQSQDQNIALILDLSWLQSFDYYTGIVFQVVSLNQGQSHILGQGGRYDQLLGLYHPQKKALPGIGFSFNIEELHASLLTTNYLPQTTPNLDYLVVPQSTEAQIAAFRYAQNLRQSDPTLRVEIDLGERSDAEVRDYARDRQIVQIVWIKDAENMIPEKVIAN
ncbi:MAG: ATP phosphoribosyltransferase regulatory subunit, partial [Microcystaceae cyanobacterium]